MIKKITSFIPNTITSLNLLSGCMAVICTFNLSEPMFGTALTGTAWCYIFIALAAIFDFCDGFSARLLHAYSPMGKELDSLSDLVSFGVAPGMLMLNTIGALSTASWVPFAALLIPVCGALASGEVQHRRQPGHIVCRPSHPRQRNILDRPLRLDGAIQFSG